MNEKSYDPYEKVTVEVDPIKCIVSGKSAIASGWPEIVMKEDEDDDDAGD